MFKKILLILLSLCLCFSAFACGGSEAEKKDEDKESTLSENKEDKKDSADDKNTDGEDSFVGETSFIGDAEETSEEESDTVSSFEEESDTVSSSESEGGSGAYAELLPEAVDMGGRKFNILQRWFGYGKPTVDFQGEVIWEDNENGDMTSINLAKKKVLEEVQNKYNCTIVGEMSTKTAGEIRAMLQEDILAGTAEYDFCFETYFYYYSFVEDGLFVDLNDLGIDFDKPWWDQNAVEDLSICGKLYYAPGDINTYDNDGTFVLLFNKDLYERKGGDVQALYDKALAGDWTFEELKNIITGFGYDANSDDIMDENDVYGLLTETDNLYNHFLASGNRIVAKDADDEPYFDLASGNGYPAIADAVELYLNSNDVFVEDLLFYVTLPERDPYEDSAEEVFLDGRGLFCMTSLIHLPYLSDMEDNFGILPIPKHKENVDRYYHNVGTFTNSMLFVPSSTNSVGEKGEQLGMIIDALGAYSKDYVTPAYYNKVLNRGDVQDSDSAEILDLIFSSRVYDLGQVFGGKWATTDIIGVLDHKIEERVERQKAFIEDNIASTVEKIKENG